MVMCTLTPALLAYVLAACTPADCKCDTLVDPDQGGEDSDDDSGDPTRDTGVAAAFWYGGAQVWDLATWSAGEFAVTAYDAAEDLNLCSVLADWYDTTGAPPDCPGCTWAFRLDTRDSVLVGDHCDTMVANYAWSDGMLDGLGYAWGWTYAFDVYGDGSLLTDETLLYYATDGDGGAWYPFAWNDGDLQGVYGRAYNFAFVRDAEAHYYFYR